MHRVDATDNSKDVVQARESPWDLGPDRRYGSVRGVGSVRGTARVLLAVGHKN